MSKVLVVDDLSTELEMICRILQDAGISVERARDGEEAIDLIQASPPDLVILDVVMPGMNGFEVVRELRKHEKTKNLLIVFCTQKNTNIDKIWGMDIGADAYITKPFEPKQLVDIVKKLISNR